MTNVAPKKKFLVSSYIQNFKPFYLSRNFNSFTYCPLTYCIFNKKESLIQYNKLMKKYFKLSNKKGTFDFNSYNITDLDNEYYTFTLDEEYKDQVNFFIDISMYKDQHIIIESVISQFFLFIREKIKGLTFVIKEETFDKLFNISLRTYSDFIFIDSHITKLLDNCSQLIAASLNFNVDLEFNNNLLCIDRSTNWIEFKVYNF